MARSQFYDSVQDSSGNFVTTSEVTVYLYGTTTKATIYENESGSTQKANPFYPTDGFINFWAEPNSYDIVITDTANPAAFSTRTVRFDSIPAVSGVINQTILNSAVTSNKISDGTVINDDLDSSSVLDKAGISSTSVKRRGVCEVAGTDVIPAVKTNTLATTPDVVTNIVLPTDGIIFVAFRGLIKSDNAATYVHANIRIGSNSLVALKNNAASGTTLDTSTNSTYWQVFTTNNTGLLISPLAPASDAGLPASSSPTIIGVVDAVFPTTPQLGGAVAVEMAAGTYDVSVRYTTSTNTASVKQRKLWVWTQGF